jgi:hypothetical protein
LAVELPARSAAFKQLRTADAAPADSLESATTMHVSDLDGAVNELGRFWEAVVTITVLDDAGAAVSSPHARCQTRKLSIGFDHLPQLREVAIFVERAAFFRHVPYVLRDHST